jgi:hypothetical protein
MKINFQRSPYDIYRWLYNLQFEHSPDGLAVRVLQAEEAPATYDLLYHGPDTEVGARCTQVSYAGNEIHTFERKSGKQGSYLIQVRLIAPCIIFRKSWTISPLIPQRLDVWRCATPEQISRAHKVIIEESSHRMRQFCEAHKDDGKKFAFEQIEHIKSLGFTRQQAWTILSASNPSRCAFAADWAVRMYQQGYRPDFVESKWSEIHAELIKTRASDDRYKTVSSKFPLAPLTGTDSVFGLEKFFRGAVVAMKLYAQNVQP